MTPIRTAMLILAAFGCLALVGAGVLLAIGRPVPNEMWLVVTNAATAIGALLANPRTGTDRQTDRIQADKIETETLEVQSRVDP